MTRAATTAGAHDEAPPVTTPDVTEYDGLRLHLNAKNPTGYLGIQREGARFKAVHSGNHIGVYDTPLEAAVAFARRHAELSPADEQEGNEGGGGRWGGGGGVRRRAAPPERLQPDRLHGREPHRRTLSGARYHNVHIGTFGHGGQGGGGVQSGRSAAALQPPPPAATALSAGSCWRNSWRGARRTPASRLHPRRRSRASRAAACGGRRVGGAGSHPNSSRRQPLGDGRPARRGRPAHARPRRTSAVEEEARAAAWSGSRVLHRCATLMPSGVAHRDAPLGV